MAERWARSNESGCGLYLDGRAVGFMDTPELARQVVETMNRVGRLLDEVRREPVGDCDDGCIQHATCRPETAIDSTGRHPRVGELCAGIGPRDAERRSEATPKNDLPLLVDGHDDCQF